MDNGSNSSSYGALKDSSVVPEEEQQPQPRRRSRMVVEMAVGTMALLAFAFAVRSRFLTYLTASRR
jgi:hypothetical protein